MIPRQLAIRLVSSAAGSLGEFQALVTPEPSAPSPTSSQPMALEYTPAQLDSSHANLEVCARHVRAYMVDHREWVECVQPPLLSALPIQMMSSVTSSRRLGFLVTQPVAALLTAIMEHKGDLKWSSINKVLQMWPSHFQQYRSYVTKMSDGDRETLQIADSNMVQAKIDGQPWEKALQASAEDQVAFCQLGIRQGSVAEAASEAINLSTFKAKEDLTTALSLLEEAQAAVDHLESDKESRCITICLRRASRALRSSWDHTQVASLANAGVSFTSMATVDVGTRAVHSSLRSLRAQELRVGTSARVHQAQQLKKMADSLPFSISPNSLFGEGLQPVIAKAASSARHYAEMAEGFV